MSIGRRDGPAPFSFFSALSPLLLAQQSLNPRLYIDIQPARRSPLSLLALRGLKLSPETDNQPPAPLFPLTTCPHFF